MVFKHTPRPSTVQDNRPQELRTLAHPVAAAAMSLVAMSAFTVVLGLFFLPAEMRKLAPPERVSVTHYLPPAAGRPGVALCWSVPEIGIRGWRHFLRLDRGGVSTGSDAVADLPTGPLSLAADSRSAKVLLGGTDGSIYSLDVGAPAKATLVGRQEGGGVVGLARSADGRFVLSQDAFCLYGWELGRAAPLWRRQDLLSNGFVVRPDKATAIVSCLSGELVEIDLATGTTLAHLISHGPLIQALAVSQEGDRLALVSAEGQLRIVDSRSLETIWERDARWSFASSRFVALSPCGRWVATPSMTSSRDVAIWDASTGAYLVDLGDHQGSVLGTAFDSDGLVYSFAADGTVRRWNISAAAFGVVRRLHHSPDA